MADDIDVLGQSLLNRQRTNRKRSDKRSRKERNINLGLNLAAKGVGYANTYLKNRADTFVNEQEELVGLRIKQQKAIGRSQATIADMDAAQAYATGPQGWLAQEKFAPIIAANVERNLETQDWSPKDINSWVYDEAAKQAEEYFPKFQESYDAAMRMGTIDDYDTYVKTKDGRAENVGGFLFNKLTRSLNNRTQADFDGEVMDSLRKNRFTENADAVLDLDKALKLGYTINEAIDLDSQFMAQVDMDAANAGIGRARILKTNSEPVQQTFRTGRAEYSITVRKYTQINEHGDTNVYYGQDFTENASGEKTFLNTDLYNNWRGSPEGSSTVNLESAEVVNPNASAPSVSQRLKSGGAELGPRPATGTEFEDKFPFIKKGTAYQIPIFLVDNNLQNEVIIGYKEERIYDIAQTAGRGNNSDIDPSVIVAGVAELEAAMNNLLVPGKKSEGSLNENKVLIIAAAGGSKENFDEYVKDETSARGTDVANALKVIKNQIAGDAYRTKLELTDGFLAGEEPEDIALLAMATELIPYLNGFDAKAETMLWSANAFGYEDFPTGSLLLADRYLTGSSNGSWEGIDAGKYEALVTQALEEVRGELRVTNNEYTLTGKGFAIVKALEEIPEVAQTTMNLQSFDDDPAMQNILLTSRGNNLQATNFTMTELISTLLMPKVEQPQPEEVNPVAADISGYELPATNSRRAAQEDDARRFQSLPNDSTPSATDAQRARIVGRQDNAAKEIQELLLENKLPSKDRGLNRAKINSALRSDVLTDEEKRVLNTWLGKDSPKVTTEVSDTAASDPEPFSGGNISEERAAEISFPSDTSASSLIKRFENFTPVATLDVAQNTNGFGTEAANDSEEITMEVAQERLLARIAEDTAFIEDFNEKYQYDWTENETIALTSFIFNLGKRSLNEVTEGGTRSKEEIADAMLLYTGAGGEQNIPGLIKRRQDEYDIFTGKVTI